MAKEKKSSKRRRRTIAGYTNMVALAGAVGFWGLQVLDRLPRGFDSQAAGKGQSWWKNKRVLIILAVLVWLIQHNNLKYRLWAIPVTALLSTAVQQHKATYQGEDLNLEEKE